MAIRKSLEVQIFERKHVNFSSLKDYGFILGEVYEYKKRIDEEFEARIYVDLKGKLTGQVYDLNFEEEYINFRLDGKLGEFAAKIKYLYIELLEDIEDQCFENDDFIYPQSNRISAYVLNKYHHHVEYTFDSHDIGVFRHDNSKWYGLILLVDYSKLDKTKSGEVEILNVKIDEDRMEELIQIPGIYRSYHMSKKSWISIVLDDEVNDELVISLLDRSYDLVDDRLNYKEWLIPANSTYFDIENLFNDRKVSIWKQSANIHIGDLVYIYASKPFSCILFRCEVLNIDIPYRLRTRNGKSEVEYVMKIKHQYSYEFGEFSLDRLKKFGVTTIRGPRHVPIALSDELKK